MSAVRTIGLAAALFGIVVPPLSCATAEPSTETSNAPAVTVFMSTWREPGAVALSPLPLASFAAVPTPWRDARWPDTAVSEDGMSLLQGSAPREFGVRVRLSETDTAFVKVLSFRGNGPRTKTQKSLLHLPQTMFDRPAAKAFAAGVKLRF